MMSAAEPTMQPREFIDQHLPALETNEARHNVMLAILGRFSGSDSPPLRYWTLGAPGHCAVQVPARPILLGDLTPAECRRLADETRELDYPGVVGPDLTAQFFADRAGELGVRFLAPILQQIHALHEAPRYTGAPGQACMVGNDDAWLFADWLIAFAREATPHDPEPDREQVMRAAGDGRYMFWVVDDEPVSMAGIVRRTRHAAAIAGVYTPPSLRGRGYGGSVTAAVTELAFSQGKTMVCLYSDLRNPFSNRCYARIGFTPVCWSSHYPRAR
jgi:RimJ/RimL family protein N-acetyltransferase